MTRAKLYFGPDISVPMEHAWWPAIAEMLPKPWPREAVLFDLRWWAGEVAFTGRRHPGRTYLAKRWGWSGRRTSGALAARVTEARALDCDGIQ